MAEVTGDGGDVTIGTTPMKVLEWSADIEATEIDITNVASGGWDDVMLGNKRMSGSGKAIWDATLNAGAPPYPLVVPQAVSALKLKISANAGELGCAAVISKLNITNATNKAVEYSFDFKSNGAVTYTAPAGGGD